MHFTRLIVAALVTILIGLLAAPAPMASMPSAHAQEDKIVCDDVTTALWWMAEMKGYRQFQSDRIPPVDTSQYDPGQLAPLFGLVPADFDGEILVNDAAIEAIASTLQELMVGQEDLPQNPQAQVVGEDPACKELRENVIAFLVADMLIEKLGEGAPPPVQAEITPTIQLESTPTSQAEAPSASPADLLPEEARQALDQRIQADFGTADYTITHVEESAGGAGLCVVFDPPLSGQLMGQTLLYDYAVIQQDGGSWSAIMVEDHQEGIVLSLFGCEAVYKQN
jgi:hypothetical protein